MTQDVQTKLTVVTRSTPILEAARLVTANDLVELVVVDENDHPRWLISTIDILTRLVPEFLLEDPALAHVYGSSAADEILADVSGRVIGELLDDPTHQLRELPAVKADATLIEIVTELIRARTTIVYVQDNKAGEPSFALASLVLKRMILLSDQR